MWFGILGAMEVRDADGAPVSVGGPRVRSLLAMLLLDPGQVVTAERLIDGLYGEDPPAGAVNALQSQVSRLRRGLGAGLVEFHPAGYRLAVDPDDVDVHRFQRLAREGGRALSGGDHRTAAELLREALALWRGPALADVADAPFADAQVARLEELRVAAVEDRVAAELALGGHRDVVAELQRLVAAHPLRERPRGLLMRALYGSGRQAEALAVYEETRQTLADELGADPSPELAAVHLAILRAEPEPTAAPAPEQAAEPAPGIPRLPAQLTSFIGRTEELHRIGKLLSDARLVTLLGPGGAGKTRLAVEVGAGQAGEVCFIDLAPVADQAELPQAVLAALGMREVVLSPGPGPAPEATERLVAALLDRPILLIFDNCEHLVGDVARLAHLLLSECPKIRILATSREALGITGEMLRPLAPLASPAPGTPAAEAMEYPAIRLFADRADAVRPGFAVTDGNVAAVLQICRALDGLPLAIELAAARLRALPLEEIVSRLSDRFRLLSRGSRTAAPRHQTLRAVVEWSWELLAPDERVLARRLTVFNGGFTLRTAGRVCGLDEDEVMDLLAGLVDKSLVTVADALGGRRYSMLDTIRTFCAERLAEAGDEDREFHRAHAVCFIELLETAEPHLRRTEQLEWLARLDAEHGNLHAALRWAVENGEVHLALRLLAPLNSYWLLRGMAGDGSAVAFDLLSRIGTEPPAELREEYAFCVLNATRQPAADEVLGPHLARVEEIVADLNWTFRYPFLNVLWATYAGPPEDPELHRRIAESMQRADPWTKGLSHLGLGMQLALFSAEPQAAVESFTAALAAFQALGERWGMMTATSELAALAELRGELATAEPMLAEAIDLAGRLGATVDLADLLCRRGAWWIRAGELDKAQADYERALEISRRHGALESMVVAPAGLGDVARHRGDLAEAERRYDEAMTVDRRWFAVEERLSSIYVARGWLATVRTLPAEARDWHRRGFTTALRRRNFGVVAAAVDGLAAVALLEGDAERAAVMLGAAASLRGTAASRDPDAVRTTAITRERLGDAPYETAFKRGQALSLEQVRDLVLDTAQQ